MALTIEQINKLEQENAELKACLQEIDEIISRTDSQHPPSVANMVSIIRHKLYELTNTEEE